MGLICEPCAYMKENLQTFQNFNEINDENNEDVNHKLISIPKEEIRETKLSQPQEKIEQQIRKIPSPRKSILRKSVNHCDNPDSPRKSPKRKSVNFELRSKSKENSDKEIEKIEKIKELNGNLKKHEKENENPNPPLNNNENKFSLTLIEPSELIEKKKSSNIKNKSKLLEEDQDNEQKNVFRSLTEKEATKLYQKMCIEEQNLAVSNEILIMGQKGRPTERYRRGRLIGTGSSGSVYEATNLVFNNIVAMKIEKRENNDNIDNLKVLNEIDILKKISHPNIAKIYEFFVSPSYYYLINEFCKYGKVYDYIIKLSKPLSENQLAVIFYQIFSCLLYLHEKNILHRDLNLEHILISDTEKDIETGEEYFWIKLTNFSISKIFEKNKKEHNVVGTYYYMAPEVFKHNYDEKSDIWSVGVILYIILCGKPPFDGNNDKEIIKKISVGEYNKKEQSLLNYSDELQDLLSKLLEKNAEKRFTAKEAIQHSWFKKYNGRKLFSNFKDFQVQTYIENCLNYNFTSKIQSLVIAFLIHYFPNTESSKLILKLFRLFNTSGNCKLTKEELEKGILKFNTKIQFRKVNEIFSMLDNDNNGYIEFEEFLRACIDKKELLTDDYLKFAFKFLDKDDTGVLESTDIMEVFVGDEDNEKVEEAFHNTLVGLDEAGSGVINFDQFKKLMFKTMERE